MTLIDFNQKELLDIYRALQYTRFEECPVPHDDEGRESTKSTTSSRVVGHLY